MKILVTLLGILGFGLCLPGKADVLNLFPPPGATSFQGQDIGSVVVGTIFDATNTFTIGDAAIQFNPFGGETGNITVDIFAVTKNSDNNGDGDLGALLATASANITDNGQQFYDVPINFTFDAGSRYMIGFADTDPTFPGWGEGKTARNLMTFWEVDPASPCASNATPCLPFAVAAVGSLGGVNVIDGTFGSNFRNMNFPAIELGSVPEPRLVGFLLVGMALVPIARKRLKPIACNRNQPKH
jgi:hypothetical protein